MMGRGGGGGGGGATRLPATPSRKITRDLEDV